MFRSSACSWLESVLKLQSTLFTHIHDVLGTIMFSLVGRGPHGLILDDIGATSAQKRKLEMSWNGFWPLLFPRICKNTYILEQERARHLPELTLHLTMPSGAIAPLERLVRADFANKRVDNPNSVWRKASTELMFIEQLFWLHFSACNHMRHPIVRRTHASTYLPEFMTTLPNISITL